MLIFLVLQRQHQLIAFQPLLNADINKILGASKTRWLSTETCIVRILEQWLPLQNFFTAQYLNDNVENARPIFNFFFAQSNRCYLKFLRFVLDKVNTMNKFLQNKEIIVHRIWGCITGIYKDLLKMFMKENYVDANDISDLNPLKEDEYLRIINLGDEANAFINLPDSPDFNNQDKNNVRNHCLQYLTLSLYFIQTPNVYFYVVVIEIITMYLVK